MISRQNKGHSIEEELLVLIWEEFGHKVWFWYPCMSMDYPYGWYER